MARNENPPFARGETFYNGGTIDTANYGGVQHEGKDYWFEDIDYGSTAQGAKPARTSKYVRCRIMRNVSGAALLPKRLVIPQKGGTDGKFYVGRVDGMASVGSAASNGDGRCYVVDEFLPAAGVPNGDLFWAVEEGPAMCLTPLSATFGAIAVGDPLAAISAVSSGATTAGRVMPITALTTSNQVLLSMVGRALSAMTTSQTNADVLVDVGRW